MNSVPKKSTSVLFHCLRDVAVLQYFILIDLNKNAFVEILSISVLTSLINGDKFSFGSPC